MLQWLQRVFHGLDVAEQLLTQACFQIGCRFAGIAQLRDLLAARGQTVRHVLFRVGVTRHLQNAGSSAWICSMVRRSASDQSLEAAFLSVPESCSSPSVKPAVALRNTHLCPSTVGGLGCSMVCWGGAASVPTLAVSASMISVSELPAGDEGLRVRWLSPLNFGSRWGWGGRTLRCRLRCRRCGFLGELRVRLDGCLRLIRLLDVHGIFLGVM
ncbi:hypothetical protein B1H41_11735 [Xanthomonas vasicola pv. vasculorum]|nr:hypothetical protein KWI_0122020 [Xanthomonas vasicola pv. vasculorum NCPPB 206]OWF60906.1 hypothetical protein B1H32_10300 [Xanthomonas vasicola pv. vasculorum]OWF61057.1 hypothetical protein B1H41_11735 [Xanthomonas vasicola pv. vasculorum]